MRLAYRIPNPRAGAGSWYRVTGGGLRRRVFGCEPVHDRGRAWPEVPMFARKSECRVLPNRSSRRVAGFCRGRGAHYFNSMVWRPGAVPPRWRALSVTQRVTAAVPGERGEGGGQNKQACFACRPPPHPPRNRVTRRVMNAGRGLWCRTGLRIRVPNVRAGIRVPTLGKGTFRV